MNLVQSRQCCSFAAMTYAGDTRSADSLDVVLVANKRKPNFTEGESLFLISQFERNSEILTSKLNDATTNKQKVEVWKRICRDYNSKNPIVLRTANDLKRKWKNMVRAAKKELLESTADSESGEQVTPRKLSPVSEKIIEILRITASNCRIGEGAGMSIDRSLATTDQLEQALLEDGEQEEGEVAEQNEEQRIVHVVAKTGEIVSPTSNNEQTVENTHQENTNGETACFSAFNSLTPSSKDQEKTPCQVFPNSSGIHSCAPVPMNIVSSFQEVGKFPSQHTVIAANASISGGGRHRILIPQQKRMLSSPLAHVIKRKRNFEYGNESPGSHVRDEIEKLKKEKLLLEKEKLALEKDKLMMEKEKLALEIQFLRDQIDT